MMFDEVCWSIVPIGYNSWTGLNIFVNISQCGLLVYSPNRVQVLDRIEQFCEDIPMRSAGRQSQSGTSPGPDLTIDLTCPNAVGWSRTVRCTHLVKSCPVHVHSSCTHLYLVDETFLPSKVLCT
jgi:hypothetical protein